MTYNNELIGIPGVIMTTARTRPAFRPAHQQVERLSRQSTGSLLGSRFNVSSVILPKEALYIQLTIVVFINGDDRELEQLWSHSGPVSALKDATRFMRMDKAVEKLGEISRMKTVEYRIIRAEIRNESAVTVGRREAA